MFWDMRWSRIQGNERVPDVGQDRLECCGGERGLKACVE